MANEQVIRRDIIQLDFDTNLKELTKITKELDELKKSMMGGLGDEEFDKLKNSANDADDALGKVKKAANGVDDSLDKVKKAANGADDSLDKVKKSANSADDALDDVKKAANNADDSLDKVKKSSNGVNDALKKVKTAASSAGAKLADLGKKGATAAFNGLKKVAGLSFKGLAVGIGAAATAVGTLVTKSVQAYADYEQLVGGVDTLFKGDSKTVQKYANDAFKTAGLSANQYMDTVTSFSASMIQSVGGDTAKAAELSNMAITDMSDNANKMGTSMDSIIETYQSLAKGNYAMLDNLKLGYGGTKKEMERLIKDAAKLDSSVDANSTSYANLVKAIHVVQDNMGITGTTAKEASSTISGSIASMKAAWGNLLPALIQGGDEFDQCVNNLIDSIVGVENAYGELEGGVINNLKPAVTAALSGVGRLIEEFAPIIERELPTLVDELLPPLIKAASALLAGLIKSLPNIAKALIKEMPDIFKQLGTAIAETFGEQFPALKQFGESLTENAKKLTKCVPYILGFVGAIMVLSKVKSIAGVFSGLFGGKGGKGKGGMFGDLVSLAKIPVTTVLKGMANLGIIFGGMMILATAYMALAPHIAKLSDLKSVAKVGVVIAITGVLGLALAKLGEIAGKIPVATVAKGLANMAIMLVGMGALSIALAWVTSKVSGIIDVKSVLKLAIIMGAVGTVGAVLSVFAGIVGMIPIPVVLQGLANMALVLGGVTALVLAFGALSKINGFNEFLKSGGETLSILFRVLGKVVGSAIGGLGEGLTNSLPKIGENLSAFAKSLSPMFTMFNGVDMAGVGSFFSALGSFMLKVAGEKILSFFSGGTDFSGVAEGLGSLTGEGVKNFFNMVKGIDPVAFENAKSFFNCLDGISKLPNVGGLGQLFSGTNDFEGVASGLKSLTGKGVKNFFTMVAGMDAVAFDNAKSFFKCLDGISKLPNVGGIGQIFTGENDFTGVAKGLKALSGKGVKNFFAMVSEIDSSTFTKTSELFESLSDIGEVGKEGFFEKLGGILGGKKDEKSPLVKVAEGLSAFAEKSKEFFAQVNKLKVGNLNGLWDSLKHSEDVTANVSKLVDEHIDDIVDKISKLPKQMGEALKSSGDVLGDSLVTVWKDAVKESVAPVNKVLEAANWILKEFGSDKRVIKWTPYAGGTDGHKGGNAVVNDGNGAEMVQMPNGNAFIPSGRNVFIPNAPKGMKVLPADQTARLMGRTAPTFHYADGIGDIDLWSYIDDSKGLVSKINDSVSYKGMSGFVLNLGKGMVSTFTGEMSAWIDKLFEEEGALSLGSYVASKGVSQWRSTVIRALKMEGQYSAANVERTLYQMQTESGGNPKAINLWDSNAKRGIPSKGLMQVIDPTFKSYARKGFNKNIYDPLSNILASIRYAVSRYGSLAKAYRGTGYANGGIATKPSIFGEDGEEMAIPLTADKRKRAIDLWAETGYRLGLSAYTPERDSGNYTTNYTEHNTYSPQFNLTISGSESDREMARKVKRWVSEGLEEAFESIGSKNPRLQEV